MNPWIRRGLVAAVLLVVTFVTVLLIGLALAEWKLHRRIDVPVLPIAVPADAAALERGRYLYAARGCGGCHGAAGTGRDFINDPGGLRVRSPNISPGPGSVVAGYRNEDWVRAVRHGVKPDGRPLFIMPSEDFNRFTDADMGALIAYMRTLPPGAGGGMVAELPLVVRLAYGFGVVTDAAQKIDHRLPPPAPVPEAVTAAHGAYVATMCTGCHGAGLGGGKIPGTPPTWPPAANLTPGEGSVLPRYRDAQAFVDMMRSGRRPDGTAVSAEMPFETFRAMSEVDLRAMYLSFRTLPPRRFGDR
jgi:mono/diheme cytochrome c family protein